MPGIRVGVHVAARQREQHCAEGSERGDVERRDPPAAEWSARRAQREEQDDHGRDHEQYGGREPAGGEHRVAEDLADRRSGPVGEDGDSQHAEPPAQDDARERRGTRLRPREDTQLVPTRAEPRQALPDTLDVAAHPGRGQDREREQERRGLAAHEQQPLTRDLSGLPRGGELVHRRGEIQEERLRAQRRTSPRRGGGEVVDLPRMHAVGGERRRPRVRAVEALEPRKRGELVEALGDEERRLGDPERVAQAGRVRARQAAERERRDERPLADLDEAQALDARHAAGAAQPDDLASLRRARLREPPRGQPHEAPDVVRGAGVHELAADPQELQLRGTDRIAGHEPFERAVDERLQILARDAVARDAEVGVDDRDRALVRRDTLERARERLVLRHEAAADHRGQRCGRGGDPEREETRSPGAVDEPVPGEAQRIADPAGRAHEYTLTEAETHDH